MKIPPVHTCQDEPNLPCAACEAHPGEYDEWLAWREQVAKEADSTPLSELERWELQHLRSRKDLTLCDQYLLESLAKREHL
jgi:hypothetical protein